MYVCVCIYIHICEGTYIYIFMHIYTCTLVPNLLHNTCEGQDEQSVGDAGLPASHALLHDSEVHFEELVAWGGEAQHNFYSILIAF
jgi:hypothetical protein